MILLIMQHQCSPNISITFLHVSDLGRSPSILNPIIFIANDGDAENLTAIDYVMIALAFVGCCGVIYYFLRKLLGKKARRRVSFEGERVAAKTVENITNTGIEEDNEDRAYFQ